MPIKGVNHVNIRTSDLDGTIKFYTDILGLKFRGPEPFGEFTRLWLYDAEDSPIIHLRALDPGTEATGPVDHVALTCVDVDEFETRLQRAGVQFGRFDAAAMGVTQLTLNDPNGVRLELNFNLR